MNDIKDLNASNLKEIIKDENIRTIKIITLAMNAGIIFFFGIILFLFFDYSETVATSTDGFEYVYILLILSLIFSGVTIITSKIIPNFSFKPNSPSMMSLRLCKDSVEKELIGIINSNYIVRFAMLEGSALFGLITLLMSITGKLIYTNSIYWLGTIPMIVMFIITYLNFPTKERVIQLINDKILSQNL